ncbi:bifunctional DNA-formamidopyrimidine glycosylase/DNA-(apurinic or apyrimidinic site) lyase [Candidatus Nomurabacteria bacterium]|nr:bifunctional DNA-formamidopyrimidine glycosylase/DNA-(apurinic or apyrimidinic site) lyase [Candidatus Nomurabacteria bacterium]
MPELPEVQTTVNGINSVAKGLKILDVWSDYPNGKHIGKDNIKDEAYLRKFTQTVFGKKILDATRRGKNVLIHLSGGLTILIHMKMTGHIMFGEYKYIDKKWRPVENSSLADPYNRFIHLVFSLSGGKCLVMSDSRKFAKVTLLETHKMYETEHLRDLGPEPLEKNFTFNIFKEQILKKPRGKIKTVLMAPEIISGIGNIYSDEILWRSSVHPESIVLKIPEKNLKEIFKAVKITLNKGIDFGGDSMSDYRNIHGERGKFQDEHRAYRKTKSKCSKIGCSGIIERKIVGTRSAHFCNKHQKIFK